MKLLGQVAWITGAGSGIGRASALALAAEGATVVVTGRRQDALQETARLCGARAFVQAGDVTNAGLMKSVAAAIFSDFKRLDIVVNNAGINITDRKWSDMSVGSIDRMLATNLSSAFYLVTAALSFMRQRGGIFIHIGSRAGRFWDGPSGAGYMASKAALNTLSHGINQEECLNGIRSTILNPGETATEILKARKPVWSADELARLMRPEDVGDLVRYIACLPSHVCVNEVMMTPTWNRSYVTALERQSKTN
jgi:NADP-dependent 3-hydroxy acid dehydrogenase YdfG